METLTSRLPWYKQVCLSGWTPYFADRIAWVLQLAEILIDYGEYRRTTRVLCKLISRRCRADELDSRQSTTRTRRAQQHLYYATNLSR
jgi:hypothetical protein